MTLYYIRDLKRPFLEGVEYSKYSPPTPPLEGWSTIITPPLTGVESQFFRSDQKTISKHKKFELKWLKKGNFTKVKSTLEHYKTAKFSPAACILQRQNYLYNIAKQENFRLQHSFCKGKIHLAALPNRANFVCSTDFARQNSLYGDIKSQNFRLRRSFCKGKTP